MKRQTIMRDLRSLINSGNNDAVKLAFLEREELWRIDGLDLRSLAEFRRSGNGGVEIKLVDRLQALELLDRLSQREEEQALGGLLDELREGQE